MSSTSVFVFLWIISAVVLFFLAWWAGLLIKGGILIDSRGRYSLTHFQILLWTITILSSMVAVFISMGLDPASINISPQLLSLMGIAAGSAVGSTAVKSAKDADGSKANVARRGIFYRTKQNLSSKTGENILPKFNQIFLQEEGALADQAVDITKFQNFIFTLIAFGVYVAIAVNTRSLPTLPENIVWLIGVSHAGYVSGKIPNK